MTAEPNDSGRPAPDANAARVARALLLGLISDTHGQLRPEVFDHFAGVDLILHAGDIGGPDLLTELEALAPVIAVHGNTDGFDIRGRAPALVEREVGGRQVVLTHGHRLASLAPRSVAEAFPEADLVVFGHTHRPAVERVGRTLVVNPGSAGPRRFDIRPSIALLELTIGGAPLTRERVRLVEL